MIYFIIYSFKYSHRCPVSQITTGQAATCALTFISLGDTPENTSTGSAPGSTIPKGFKLRKGQVLLGGYSATDLPGSSWEFEAEMKVLYHPGW